MVWICRQLFANFPHILTLPFPLNIYCANKITMVDYFQTESPNYKKYHILQTFTLYQISGRRFLLGLFQYNLSNIKAFVNLQITFWETWIILNVVIHKLVARLKDFKYTPGYKFDRSHWWKKTFTRSLSSLDAVISTNERN